LADFVIFDIFLVWQISIGWFNYAAWCTNKLDFQMPPKIVSIMYHT
jgi:hypothetical protein